MSYFKTHNSLVPLSNFPELPYTKDLESKKDSSKWTYLTGLFVTAIDFLSSALTPNKFRNRTIIEQKIEAAHYIDAVNPEDARLTNHIPALDQLHNRDGRFFGSSVVATYLTALKTLKPKIKFDFTSQGLENLHEFPSLYTIFSNNREAIRKSSLYAIPFNNNGHHVVLLIDKNNKRIEYYDPKGATCGAKESQRVPSMNFVNDIKKINTELFLNTGNYWQNLKQHQEDHHNCGIWSSYYITQRVNSKTPEQVASNPAPSVHAIKKTMIACIEQDAKV